MISPQEVQTKIASWKKQIEGAKQRIMRIKVEGEQAEKNLEEVHQKCAELGVDPSNLEEAIAENEKQIQNIMSEIRTGIEELNDVLSQLESV